MTKYAWFIGFGLVLAAVPALADDAVSLKYRYSPGQVLRYDGKQLLTVESTVAGTTQKFSSETTSMREWRVLGVDGKGNARLACFKYGECGSVRHPAGHQDSWRRQLSQRWLTGSDESTTWVSRVSTRDNR